MFKGFPGTVQHKYDNKLVKPKLLNFFLLIIKIRNKKENFGL